LSLELPPGWKAEPAGAPLDFTHEDEWRAPRLLNPDAARVKAGAYTLRAVVASRYGRPKVR
jgi:hypothetical protein